MVYNMDERPTGAAPEAVRFEGRSAFQQLVRDALARAAQEGWRELVLCDATFEDWPLGERAVAESLNAWSTGSRRITLLAKNYNCVVRNHARFVTWRRTWSHIVDARACPGADPLELPSTIWSPHWVMQRLDPVHCNGYVGTEPRRCTDVRELLHEWLARSSPAFAATTLGL